MTKPFNLADAKAGHPITTPSGLPTRLLSTDVAGGPLLVQQEGRLYFANELGAYWPASGAPCVPCNLVMAPVGRVDGRDVYPGDMLRHCGGEETPVPHGVPFDASEWAWPREYPVTQMTGLGEYPTSVANAAIAHGIDHSYLFTKKQMDDLGGLLRKVANRVGVELDALDSYVEEVVNERNVMRERVADASAVRKINDDYFEVLLKVAELVGHEAPTALAELPSYVSKLVTERDELLKMNGNQAGEVTRLRELVTERDKVLGEIHKLVGVGARWCPETVLNSVQRIIEGRDARRIFAVKVGIETGWKEAYRTIYARMENVPPAIPRSDENYLGLLTKAPR